MANNDAEAYMLILTMYGKKKDVANRLIKFKQVENVHELYGQYDIIAKIRASSLRELEDFIQQNIRAMKDIERTETLIVSDVPLPK